MLPTADGMLEEPPGTESAAAIGRQPISPVLGGRETDAQGQRPPRPDRTRPWLQRPKSASGTLNAPQRAATYVLELLAEQSEEERRMQQLKQAKIRFWLQQKDDELQERQRAEEAEARQINEETEQKQKIQLAREAEEKRQKLCRLQAAFRRKQELELDVQKACDGKVNSRFALKLQEQHACEEGAKVAPRCKASPRCKAGMASALATYGKLPRPASARTRAR